MATLKENIVSVRGFTPKIHPTAFVFPNATIIGDVEIGEKSSIWPNVTIRGDVFAIRIGQETNVQDGTVIHGTYQRCGTTLQDRVTIGHQVTLHGCEIGKGSLIGMGSIIMDNAKIGESSLVGAGSLVTEGSVFPPRSLILGRPAKVKRELTQEEVALLEESADNYLLYSSWYTS
jgi:carbonic anhydrase/acetyltransferase-like protein (isoleucine patch superfamily)